MKLLLSLPKTEKRLGKINETALNFRKYVISFSFIESNRLYFYIAAKELLISTNCVYNETSDKVDLTTLCDHIRLWDYHNKALNVTSTNMVIHKSILVTLLHTKNQLCLRIN